MYRVFCDGYPLLDWRDNDLILVNPKVKLAVNKVGEASFTLYKNHPHYDKLKRSRSIFEIADEIGVIFRGRMTGDTIDFDNGKAVDLEGAMAYFNDSIVRPYHFPDDFLSDPEYIAASKSGNVIQFYLNWVITNHNSQVQEFQQFKLGNVTVSDPNNYLYRYGEKYASTWETLQADLFNSALGGYLCIRYEADGNYIDYLSKFEQTNTQEIVFGENLMDLKNETDGASTYSAIIPLGGEIQRTISKGTVEGAYVDFELTETIKESVNIKGLADGYVTDDIVKKGDTLYSVSAVQQCGWIYAPPAETTWDDVTKAENLLVKGIEWLQTKGMMSSNTIEVTAVDLHFSDAEISSFRMYRNINVRSAPHGVVSTYPLSELDIDLLNPQSTKITVGESRLTLIDKQYSENTSTADKIVDMNSQGTLVGIANVKTLYYLSTSGEELEGGEWVTEEPTRAEGTYIWTKSVILYTDKSTYESPPSCSTGSKGDPGIGVDVIETEFYLSDSDTTQSGGSWVTAMPKWSEGKYLWIRSAVHYSDGSVSYTAPICDSSWEAVNDLDNKLDHEEVFNRLTDDGKQKGFFKEDGEVCVNADYIKSGTVDADLIKAGIIKSKDGNGVVIDLDNGVSSLARGTAASFNDWNGEDVESGIKAFLISEASKLQNETIKDYAIRVDAANFADGANVQLHKFTNTDGMNSLSATFFWSDGKINHWTAYDEGANAWYWANASEKADKEYVDQTAICYGEYAISSLDETDAVMTAIVNSIGGYGKRFIMFNYNGQLFGCTVYRGTERYSWAEADSYTSNNAYKMHRVMLAGVWQPWEWENPPMVAGVEYRTTKRHNGKPIYRKAVYVGAMPNATSMSIPHGIANVDFTFPVSGCMVHNAGNNVVSIPYFESTSNFVGITTQRDRIVIVTGGNSSAFNGTLHLEYTKSTD